MCFLLVVVGFVLFLFSVCKLDFISMIETDCLNSTER